MGLTWLGCIASGAWAQPAGPAAKAEVVEVGALDPRIARLRALPGLKVEIAVDAVIRGDKLSGMAFGDDGTLLLLGWDGRGALRTEAEELELPGGARIKVHKSVSDAAGWLKAIEDRDGDGTYDNTPAVMDDLELPSGLLLYEGWTYWTSGGRLLRRRPHEAELLSKLAADATAERGPPTKASDDGRWIEQQLVRGLAAVVPFQAGCLVLGPDGLLYVACGSGTTAVLGWDGSRATVVRSGSILRMRPDGTRVEEFARGLISSAASVAFGPQGEVLAADANWVAEEPNGQRLIHVLEGGDYGWMHARPESSDASDLAAVIQRPDRVKASSAGNRPGTLAAMAEVEGGQPAAMLVYSGTRLPEPLRGVLVVADPQRGELAAWRLRAEEGALQIARRQTLLQGDARTFQPLQVAQGPDGAIYVGSETEGDTIAIYRISWSGTDDAPAIDLSPLGSWKGIAEAPDEELFSLASGEDGELRGRAVRELVARAQREAAAPATIRQGLIDLTLDTAKPESARAAGLLATTQLADIATREAWGKLLASESASFRQLAIAALGNHPPLEKDAVQAQAETVQYALGAERNALATRTANLALGKLAAAGSTSAAEWSFEATSVTFGPGLSRYAFDGHVRGLEVAGGETAKELMLGNLFVAIDFDITEFDERQRIKNFVVATAEAMRTRALAEFLDALLRGEEDYLAKMEAPLEARLIAAYQNVHTIPPINADAVAEWIEKHPGGPAEVELAALETLSLVGTTKPAVIENLAASLLKDPVTAKQVATRLLAGRIDRALAPEVAAGLRQHVADDATGEMAMLQGQIERQFPKP